MPTLTENFTGTNGDALNGRVSTTGGVTCVSNGATISANTGQCTSNKYAVWDCGSADFELITTLANIANSGALLLRLNGSGNGYGLYAISNYVHLHKITGYTTPSDDPLSEGTGTSIWEHPLSATDVLKVLLSGSTITVSLQALGSGSFTQLFQRTGVTTVTGSVAGIVNLGGGGAPAFDDLSITPVIIASFVADRVDVLSRSSGTVTPTLTGTNTSWAGTPFSLVSPPAGWSIFSQHVNSTTSATITLNRGTGTGAFQISDGTSTYTITAVNVATSLKTGSWNDITAWDVNEEPIDGDAFHIASGHTITDTGGTVGSSPSNSTTIIGTIDGNLLIPSGITRILRGNTNVPGTIQIGDSNGGGVLIFDSSQAGDPTVNYKCVLGAANVTTFRLDCRGLASSYSQIYSDPAGGNGYFTATANNTGAIKTNRTRFTRIGTASIPALLCAINAGTADTFLCSETIWKNCGEVKVASSFATGMNFSLINCTHRLPAGTSSLYLTGSAAAPSGTRLIKGCVFEGTVRLACRGMSIGDTGAGDVNFFFQHPSEGTFDGRATVVNMFLRDISAIGQIWRMGDWTEVVHVCDGNTYNGAGRYSSKAQLANVHWTTVSNGPVGSYSVTDLIVESFGMDSDAFLRDDADGDYDYGPDATHSSAFLRWIMVPQNRDSSASHPTSPACITTNLAGTSSTYDRGTHYIGDQFVIALDESTFGTASQITSAKNTIGWNSPGAGGVGTGGLIINLDSPGFAGTPGLFTDDAIADGAADYNVQWETDTTVQLSTGAKGYKYKKSVLATIPGANDLFVNPNFIDSTRRFWKWVKSKIGSNVIPAPWTGGSTLTVASDVKMGGSSAFYTNTGVYGSQGTPPTTGWKDYCAWGIYKISLKNEPFDPDYEAAYSVASYKAYIRGGFTPTNVALQGTGFGAVDRGAIQTQPADTTKPTVIDVQVSANGETLTIEFSENVEGVDAAEYTLTGKTLSNEVGSGTTWTMTITPKVYQSTTVKLGYTSNSTIDLATPANVMDTFSNKAVTNNSNQAAPSSGVGTIIIGGKLVNC